MRRREKEENDLIQKFNTTCRPNYIKASPVKKESMVLWRVENGGEIFTYYSKKKKKENGQSMPFMLEALKVKQHRLSQHINVVSFSTLLLHFIYDLVFVLHCIKALNI